MIDFNDILNIRSESEFENIALQIFHYQFEQNSVYRSFCDLLYITPSDVKEVSEIPCLPIQFFKTHKVLSSDSEVQTIFKSSGTTGIQRSNHYITDLSKYEGSFNRCFELFYSKPEDYVLLALLPSYLEQGNSSLVYMVDQLIKRAKPGSGFFLHDTHQLVEAIEKAKQNSDKIFLIGVSYALLDLAQSHKLDLSDAVVMETGGMKGRRKEILREELHNILKQSFNIDQIHSEYGMTELLSQAYSQGKGIFKSPPWMKILIRDPEDPFSILEENKSGGINIIDLANLDSCAFIATQDLGRVHANGTFEIIGRFDHSDIRGCNLMAI